MNTQTQTQSNTNPFACNIAALIHDRIGMVSSRQHDAQRLAEAILEGIANRRLVLPTEGLALALRELAKAQEFAGCMDEAISTLDTAEAVLVAKRPTLGKLCRRILAA